MPLKATRAECGGRTAIATRAKAGRGKAIEMAVKALEGGMSE